MPTLNFTIKYEKNDGLVLSPSELISQYLFGLPLCTKDGRQIESSTIQQKILNAQDRIEKFLMIKLSRQVIEEQRDFMRNDYFAWGFTSLDYPMRQPLSLTGWINSTKQTTYPLNWISTNKTNQEENYSRNLHIVPGGDSSPTTNSVVFLGIIPNLNYLGAQNIPNYWTVKYVTGLKKVPGAILDLLGKIAAIEMLLIMSDLIITPGVSSNSLSFDGLSQSITATAYTARIKQYNDDIKTQGAALKDYYKGITFMTM